MYRVLTIAGSDSGGGAGIQADLKTFQAFGVYGTSAITAVTAQNRKKIIDIHVLPANLVGLQIDAVMEEGICSVWKTGMLGSLDVVETVALKAKQYRVKQLIVDPVMVATSGRRLLQKNAKHTLIKELLPLAFAVTPNIPEAEALTDMKIRSIEDMKKAAMGLYQMGTRNVVVKGGHLSSPRHSGERQRLQNRPVPSQTEGFWTSQNDSKLEVIDILYDGRRFYEFKAPWVKARNTHGTGCTFSAAIAAELAKGMSMQKAVFAAKNYVARLLKRNRSQSTFHFSL